ncbi:hypothetical protein RGQ13_09175 [Thalassotalea psychrophila]|uniref:Neuromedin U n=1 Tax=Thalassotalea psychrophila TaxID=3065647 RepID=A0ABY9U0V4_9GAMM|nr:hypothetical protein RGQ13_09175 [Colwelliaceae bacterium SQ149]
MNIIRSRNTLPLVIICFFTMQVFAQDIEDISSFQFKHDEIVPSVFNSPSYNFSELKNNQFYLYASDSDSSGNGLTPEQQAKRLEIIAKMTANPIGNAWMIWLQNDWSHLEGDFLDDNDLGGQMVNSTKFQPVMPFPFKIGDDDWNFLVRPVLQYQSVPLSEQGGLTPSDRTSSMGDTALLTLVGPSKLDGFVWAVGATQIFDTAEEDVTGQGKYQVGPAVLVASLAKNAGGWNRGALFQHWWSQSGDEDRADTSLTDIQYFVNYRLSTTELVGMSPNIKYDWKAAGGQRLTLPVGLGYSNVYQLGPLPVRVAVELQYNVVRPDDLGVDWNLRFMFIPVLPNPFVEF